MLLEMDLCQCHKYAEPMKMVRSFLSSIFLGRFKYHELYIIVLF